MPAARLSRVGLLWTQFSPYHIDRCEAAAARLAGRAEILAVEVATTSALYAWEPSQGVAGARKITLFPGQSYDAIPWTRRLRAQFAALRTCDTVFVGISYGERDIILLAYLLRLVGVRMVMMTESKFDDYPRRIEKELSKTLVFAPYAGVVVGGDRQAEYMRFLGYRRRAIVPGYDAVNLDRVRALGGGIAAPGGAAYADRLFVFVGRFVPKKSVPFLIDAYARYVALAGAAPRRLVLVGGGEEEARIAAAIDAHGLGALVERPGFLQADGVAATLARALCLVLPSAEEQWGLVVNEALAFHLPLIVSESVGSRATLIRNLVNGFVIERGSVEGFARAMLAMAGSEDEWRRMVGESAARAGDAQAERFADAVEQMYVPQRV